MKYGHKPIDHHEREEMIESNGFLVVIRNKYKELKRMSRAVRYDLAPYGQQELNKAKKLLGEIKALIEPKL